MQNIIAFIMRNNFSIKVNIMLCANKNYKVNDILKVQYYINSTIIQNITKIFYLLIIKIYF